jgi:hypothetical protein
MFARCGSMCAVLLAFSISPAAQPQHTPGPPEFTSEAAAAPLDQIREGLDSHDAGLLLSAFDAANMPDYGGFRDQVRALFTTYESFRSFYRITESRAADGGGVVLAEFELEAVPAGGGISNLRRQAQIRFDLRPGKDGWKIVDLSPRGFFS